VEFEYRKYLKFASVGAATAGIYFSILALLLEIIKTDYKLGVSVAYTVSVVFQFLANKYFTFESRSKNIAHQFSRFLVLLLLNYVLTMLIVRYVVENLGFNPYIGVAASVPVIFVTGFVLSRYWIYTDKLG